MTNLTVYQGSADEDVLLAAWYWRMARDGDLPRLFTADSQTMRMFFKIVAKPSLMYLRDEEGIWFAAWAEPWLNALMTGLWVRQGLRGRRALHAWLDVLAIYLEAAPTVFGVTRQKNLLESHTALGYDVVDTVEELWAPGEPAWLVKLTRAGFARACEKYRRRPVLAEAVMG